MRTRNYEKIDSFKKLIQLKLSTRAIAYNGVCIQFNIDPHPCSQLTDDIHQLLGNSNQRKWFIHHAQIGEATFRSIEDSKDYLTYLAHHDMVPCSLEYVNEHFRDFEHMGIEDYHNTVKLRASLGKQ